MATESLWVVRLEPLEYAAELGGRVAGFETTSATSHDIAVKVGAGIRAQRVSKNILHHGELDSGTYKKFSVEREASPREHRPQHSTGRTRKQAKSQRNTTEKCEHLKKLRDIAPT